MSVINYFARLNSEQLESWQRLRSPFDNLPQGVEVIDLDKATDVIAWLLSPGKRIEQLHFAQQMAEMLGDEVVATPLPQMPEVPDEFSVAIEGRGPNRTELAGVDACRFDPKEVKDIAALLVSVSESDLRTKADYKLMDTVCLPVEYWQEEGDQTMAEYILPNFAKLKQFYVAAAKSDQIVLVWAS